MGRHEVSEGERRQGGLWGGRFEDGGLAPELL